MDGKTSCQIAAKDCPRRVGGPRSVTTPTRHKMLQDDVLTKPTTAQNLLGMSRRRTVRMQVDELAAGTWW